MLDSRGIIAKLRLRKERNAKSGAAGNRHIARTRGRMARDCWKPKGPGAPSAESRPFSRHREECIVARRLVWFYRGRGAGIFENCCWSEEAEVLQVKDRQEMAWKTGGPFVDGSLEEEGH